jgi:hypothetical protein
MKTERTSILKVSNGEGELRQGMLARRVVFSVRSGRMALPADLGSSERQAIWMLLVVCPVSGQKEMESEQQTSTGEPNGLISWSNDGMNKCYLNRAEFEIFGFRKAGGGYPRI